MHKGGRASSAIAGAPCSARCRTSGLSFALSTAPSPGTLSSSSSTAPRWPARQTGAARRARGSGGRAASRRVGRRVVAGSGGRAAWTASIAAVSSAWARAGRAREPPVLLAGALLGAGCSRFAPQVIGRVHQRRLQRPKKSGHSHAARRTNQPSGPHAWPCGLIHCQLLLLHSNAAVADQRHLLLRPAHPAPPACSAVLAGAFLTSSR